MALPSRRAIAIGAPLVAIATLMIALRVGAGDAVTAAVVYAAPPGRPPAEGAPVPFAWQILTYLSDRGVRETVSVKGLTVVARAKGHEATWRGDSNEDGIAEANLALPDIAPGDAIELEVRADGDALPLAAGSVEWRRDLGWSPAARPGEVGARPSKREGAIAIDVLVEGERLVVGEHTPVFVRAVPPQGVPARGLTLALAPEAGLTLGSEHATVACDSGWTEISALAQAHVIALGITARDPGGARTGSWFGALPVAPGAFLVNVPRLVAEGAEAEVALVAPNPRNVAYVEIDDEKGRVFAAALPVVTEPGDPTPRARFTMPKLARGLHWLVASGEPRGAERLAGAAIARAFLVGDADGIDAKDPCALGPWLAQRPGTGFPRWQALDGMTVRGAKNRERRTLGLVLGGVALGAAALLEVLLMIAGAREANAVRLLAELEDDDASRKSIAARPPGGSLAIGVLLAVLGFSLLAALFVTKS